MENLLVATAKPLTGNTKKEQSILLKARLTHITNVKLSISFHGSNSATMITLKLLKRKEVSGQCEVHNCVKITEISQHFSVVDDFIF